MDKKLIEEYAVGGPLLAMAIDGLDEADFLATPVEGAWSIQQIVLHLMDADLIAADRMKRVIAEENPTIIGFDETKFAKNLHYDKLDPFIAAEIFDNNRQLTAIILRNVPASAFKRTGMHSERGKMTLEDILSYMTKHLHHHLKFVIEKRKLLGKPVE